MALTLGTTILVLGGMAGCSQDVAARSDEVPIPVESKEELERAKLAAEIESIRAADRDRLSAESRWLRWAPFVTALVGLGALVAAIVKQGSDMRLHRSKDLTERRAERTRRYDETLSSVVKNLGSSDNRVRLNAAASLAPLLRLSGPSPQDGDLSTPWAEAVPAEDMLPLFIANLRTEDDEDVTDILVRNLGLALQKLNATGAAPDQLDLTRVYLRRLKISGVRFKSVDIAFSVIIDSDLSHITAKRLRGFGSVISGSRFTGSNLQEARLNNSVCVGTRFHEAQLVSATFKSATLNAAQFHRARLQSAHFEDAVCIGTNFRQADVADTWFCDSHEQRCATLDDAALSTLAKANNWRSAHLSAHYRTHLEQLSAEVAAQPSGAG